MYSMPSTAKEKTCSQRQEVLRKCVDRLFSVLFKRFHVLANPSRLRDKDELKTVILTCIFMHDMIIEERQFDNTKDGVDGARNCNVLTQEIQDADEETEAEWTTRASLDEEDLVERQHFMAMLLNDCKTKSKNQEFCNALVGRIWSLFGEERN